MKQLFFFLLAMLFVSQQLSANSSKTPPPLCFEIEQPDAMFPIAIAILAEAAVATTVTVTTTDVVVVGGLVGIAYFTQNPPDLVHTTEYVPVSGGHVEPPNNNKPKWRIRMWPEEYFMLAMGAGEALRNGYWELSNDFGQPSKDQVKLALEKLYQADLTFAEAVNELQRKYDKGEPIAIPVYRPDAPGIFSHFIYAVKAEWPKPQRIEPKPGSPFWDAGINRVTQSFANLKNGTWVLADLHRVLSFSIGDCLGGASCETLKAEVRKFFNSLNPADEDFVRKVTISPALLDVPENLARFVKIIDDLPGGDLKEMLRGFLCRIPKFSHLPICGGEMQERFFYEEAIEIVESMDRPADSLIATKYDQLVEIAQQVEAADKQFDASSKNKAAQKTYGEQLLALEERAEVLVEEFWELVEASDEFAEALPQEALPADSSMAEIDQMVNQLSATSNENLLKLAGEMRDFQSKVSRTMRELQKRLEQGKLHPADREDAILALQKEFAELKKKFKDFINVANLPTKVRRCDSTTAGRMLAELGDSPVFYQYRVLAKIFGECHEKVKKMLKE